MKKLNSPWRIISTAVYGAPNEGKIYGALEVDVTKAWEMIMANRAEGRRITMTHLVAAAVGRAIGWDIPEMNAFVKRGSLVQRDQVIVTVAVNMHGGKEMTSVKLYDAHKKTVFEIAEELDTGLTTIELTGLARQEPGSRYRIHFLKGALTGPPRCVEHTALLWADATDLNAIPLAPVDAWFVRAAGLGRSAAPAPEP